MNIFYGTWSFLTILYLLYRSSKLQDEINDLYQTKLDIEP